MSGDLFPFPGIETIKVWFHFLEYNRPMSALSIVLQAGGQSTRMGEDKGLMSFGGATLIEYILSQIDNLSDTVLVVSNQPYAYAFLGLPVFADVRPGIGALGGLLTAMTYVRTNLAFVLACDMPFINRDLINFMIEQAADQDVVVPVYGDKHYIEPFRGLYAKTCLPAIEKAVLAGKRRAIAFHPDVRVRLISQQEVENYDPGGQTFINVNTPEDYRKALQVLKN